MNLLAAAGRLLKALLLGFAALVIFIEEWGWRPLTALVARIARWPPLAWLEARVSAAPRRTALALFLVPVLVLLPVKLGALWLIEQGRPVLGIGLIVLAKIVSTALVGRLFILLERQLMSFPFFARFVHRWRGVKLRVLAALRRSALWRSLRSLRRTVRSWVHRAVH